MNPGSPGQEVAEVLDHSLVYASWLRNKVLCLPAESLSMVVHRHHLQEVGWNLKAWATAGGPLIRGCVENWSDRDFWKQLEC